MAAAQRLQSHEAVGTCRLPLAGGAWPPVLQKAPPHPWGLVGVPARPQVLWWSVWPQARPPPLPSLQVDAGVFTRAWLVWLSPRRAGLKLQVGYCRCHAGGSRPPPLLGRQEAHS